MNVPTGETEVWMQCFLAALHGRSSSSGFYRDQMPQLVESAATIADEAEKLLARREAARKNDRRKEIDDAVQRVRSIGCFRDSFTPSMYFYITRTKAPRGDIYFKKAHDPSGAHAHGFAPDFLNDELGLKPAHKDHDLACRMAVSVLLRCPVDHVALCWGGAAEGEVDEILDVHVGPDPKHWQRISRRDWQRLIDPGDLPIASYDAASVSWPKEEEPAP